MTYEAEIWFWHESKDIEKIHHGYCKYVLKVSRHTPNIFVRDELGTYTIYNARCMKFVKYWLRILHMSNHKLPKICYKLQCK